MSDIDTARLRDRPTPLDAEVAIWLLTQRIDYDMDDDQGRIDSIVATLRAQADRIAELERTAAAAGQALREAQERDALLYAAPPPTPAVPDDWVLVPREPTREMVASAVRDCGGIGGGSVGERQSVDGDDMRAVWDTMIAAAPPPPQQGGTR